MTKLTDEEIIKANSVNIMDLAVNRGYEVVRKNGEIRIADKHGLVISKDGTKWNHFSEKTGGGPIQFLMHMEGKTWLESINELLNKTNSITYVQKNNNSETTKAELILPEKNDNYKKMFAYLIKTRKIDTDVIQLFVDKKQLYQDIKGNCVFVGYDENNQSKFASLRGTNSEVQFRGDCKNSNKEYSFNLKNESDTLFIFESPIDMMSYMTLMQKHRVEIKGNFISLGGLSTKPLDRFLSNNDSIEKIIICVDNDEAGQSFTKALKTSYSNKYFLKEHKPKAKDFNEQLVNEIERDSYNDDSNINKASNNIDKDMQTDIEL